MKVITRTITRFALLSTVLATCPLGHTAARRDTTKLPATYKNTMSDAEWTELRFEIGKVYGVAGPLPKNIYISNITTVADYPVGPTVVRLAWHQAGTYNTEDGTGGPHGDIDLSNPTHKGLTRALQHLAPVQEKWQDKISKADLWSFAASVYISNNFGPEIKWRPGRVDFPVQTGNNSYAPRLPEPEFNATRIRSIFNRMGLNDEEIVAIQGAHTLGFCSPINSAYDGSWSVDARTFSNDLFKRLVSIEGENKMNYTLLPNRVGRFGIILNPQWEAEFDGGMMLPSDVLLITDPIWGPISRKFAANEQYFFKKFAKAFQKLNELGVEHGLGKYVSTVIPGKQIPKYNIGYPVLTNPVNLYYIFYGEWSATDVERVSLIGSEMSKSTLYKHLKEYYYQESEYSRKIHVDGSVHLKATTFTNYTMGRILYPGNVSTIVSSVVGKGKPLGSADPNGVYLFMFSPDVYEFSSFGSYCWDWCQYHTSVKVEGVDIAYGSFGTKSSGKPPILTGDYNNFGCNLCSLLHTAGPYDISSDYINSYIIDTTMRAILNPRGPATSWADQFGREGTDICSNGMRGNIDQLTPILDPPGFANLEIAGVWTH
ncbi:hypothetical protein HDV01_003709, partial [Terramyces sp. JEL0728]